MKIITDIKEIENISHENERENWEFRAFLKRLNISSKKLDNITHQIYEIVSKEIDCKECANCCKTMRPFFNREDIIRFSTGIKQTVEQFIDKYLEEDKTEINGHIMSEKPCPFLKDNLCSYYDLRPEVCRSFPNIHKNDFRIRLWSVVENCSICPIVFNVYEELKKEFCFS